VLLILHYLVDKNEREGKPCFKLILMSATMPNDIIQQFSTIWDDEGDGEGDDEWSAHPGARTVAQVNVREQRHNVEVRYLNEFAPTICNELSIDRVQFRKDDAVVHSDLYDVVARLIASFDEDEKREMRRTSTISGWSTLTPVGGAALSSATGLQSIVRGAVLIFVPGFIDIVCLSKRLRERDLVDRLHLIIVPLHSSIPLEEQRAVFAKVGPHERKVSRVGISQLDLI
jgi:HrpA-like RNA helicase